MPLARLLRSRTRTLTRRSSAGDELPTHLVGPLWRRGWSFTRRVVQKSDEDGIFFMAGAISFSVLIAFVPLFLFVVGVAGMLASSRFGDPAGVLIAFMTENLPVFRGDLDVSSRIRDEITTLLADRTGFTVVGALLLIWFGGRLVETLRIVLREIFDMGQYRSLIRGKMFDVQVVLLGGVLFLINLGVTAVLKAWRDFGINFLGLEGQTLGLVQRGSVQALAVLAIWLLFLFVYRYLPARRLPWETALIAATFTAAVHELLKGGFGWYVSEVANYGSAYGNLISLAVLLFWIYYEAIGFILGGEVAQVWTMREARRVQIREIMRGEE